MHKLHSRLFLRLISKAWEIYFLKVITLSIAFASSIPILFFFIHELNFDRFHKNADGIVRVLQRNEQEKYVGNRLTNRIPGNVYQALQSRLQHSMLVARVKILDQLTVEAKNTAYYGESMYAVDSALIDIFTFSILEGSLEDFKKDKQTAIISASSARHYFGNEQAEGRKLNFTTAQDTLIYTIAAVYEDYPENSHESFHALIKFDTADLKKLDYEPEDFSLYAHVFAGDIAQAEEELNTLIYLPQTSFSLQAIADIYFGPRVIGENAKHGDSYSMLILFFISCLILFLALTNFINLTTLSLPARAKELAVKKVAGASKGHLTLALVGEFFALTLSALLLAILLLLLLSEPIQSVLSTSFISVLSNPDKVTMMTLIGLILPVGVSPLLMAIKFIQASPTRLLSTDTISFPNFKRIITILQLGIGLCLIGAGMVVKRQINYSLLKEPGRNHDQVVYISYPPHLTASDFYNLKSTWVHDNPYIDEITASSHLPHRLTSRQVQSGFYEVKVDTDFADFFDLHVEQGRWFMASDYDRFLINEKGKEMPTYEEQYMGVVKNFGSRFNQAEKAIEMRLAKPFEFNYLYLRVLEVDIRETIEYLHRFFELGSGEEISFLDKRFEDWLRYENRLGNLSGILSVTASLIACCAIYSLSLNFVQDNSKQIAIRKIFGASLLHVTFLLIKRFLHQLGMALLIFLPLVVILLNQWLRNFVYSTNLIWTDVVLPLGYCVFIITVTCSVQALKLNKASLPSLLI